ncbi:hypothetical protein F4604DRAFT_1998595 [Suillus subluteus]|nr:hypothetical protein F4604DRAFT_1998595 [Suillus subluteus]
MAPSSANNPTPPPATAPATRGSRQRTTAKALFAPSKTIEEHLAGTDTRTDIITIASARKQLSTNGMIISTAGGTVKHLIEAIFEMSLVPTLGATHSESLRAIAIILNEVEQTIDTNNIIIKLAALLGGLVATLDEKMDTFTTSVDKQIEVLEKTVQEVSKQLENSVTGLGEAVEQVTLLPKQAQQNTEENSESQGPCSYAVATKMGIPTPLTKLLSRSEAQARQILIDRRSLQSNNDLKELTEVQLVTKAELALELMSKARTKLLENISILSARKLPHGGILYEFNAPTSAEWINIPANRSNFLNHFGTDIIIKECAYHLLLENVPISFDPNSKIILAEMERKGGLEQDDITKA